MSHHIRSTRSLVVNLDNRPGMLGKLAQLLGTEEINILGYAAIAEKDHGTVHLLTDDAATAETLLESAGYTPRTQDAVIVDVSNEAGELGRLADRLGHAGVNIDASFVAAAPDGSGFQATFAVEDAKTAEKALAEMD